ncbi:MAG: hypothetical protein PWQ97_285 [Tepidanaerobacteraceae bacterium]|nr:hypothetical protein [Tepidanaerobacteraceae bacterium]
MKLPAITLGARELKRQKPLMTGTDIRRLQQMLKWLGFFNSRIDGVFGYETELAVMKFQKAFNIKPSGIVEKKLLDVLCEMEKGEAWRWRTIQKDYSHTAFSPMPVPWDLKIVGKKRMPGIIIGLCRYGGILVAVTRSGVCAMDIKTLKTRWNNRSFIPASWASVSAGVVAVPAENLMILDVFSGKLLANINFDTFLSPPAIAGGIIIAQAGGSTYAFDERGSLLWRYKTEGALCSPPAVAYDLIYFASSDGNIYCLDKEGAQYWKVRVNDIISEPLSIWDGRVLAVSRSACFYAINPLTGELMWKKEFADGQFLAPAFQRDFMLTVDIKGCIFAMSPRKAEIIWTKELKAQPSSLPIICCDTVFLGTESGIAAVRIKSGETRVFLEGKKITALIQARFGIIAAAGEEMVVLS